MVLQRGLPAEAELWVPLQQQIAAAVCAVSHRSTYPPGVATGHLFPGQLLLLALLQALAGGDRQASAVLAELLGQVPQVRSTFLRVWLADDYTFCRGWLVRAMSTAASMVLEGSLSLGSSALAAFSSLPAKYALSEHFLASGDITALGFVTYLANISKDKGSVNVTQDQQSERTSEGVSGQEGMDDFQTPSSYKDLAVKQPEKDKPSFSKEQHKSEAVITESRLPINESRHLSRQYEAKKAAQKRLMLAVEYNIWTAVSVAISEGADPNLSDENGHTPLSLAAVKGLANVARVLLESGASVNSSSEVFGASALCLAAIAGHDEALKLLLVKGADTAAVDDHGLTPLHRAAECGRSECIRALVDAGAALDARAEDHRASTALQLAADQGHLEAVQVLLGCGADPNAIDNCGWTALTSAAIKGHDTVSEVLMSNGGIDITRISRFLNPH